VLIQAYAAAGPRRALCRQGCASLVASCGAGIAVRDAGGRPPTGVLIATSRRDAPRVAARSPMSGASLSGDGGGPCTSTHSSGAKRVEVPASRAGSRGWSANG
jgi:hypothetical protein